MQKNAFAETNASPLGQSNTVLELTVNNHPGVMSHICSLFSRRAYNLEGIVCIPQENGETSRMWLRVNEDVKLEQVIKQVRKLPDILTLVRHDAGHKVFDDLAIWGKQSAT